MSNTSTQRLGRLIKVKSTIGISSVNDLLYRNPMSADFVSILQKALPKEANIQKLARALQIEFTTFQEMTAYFTLGGPLIAHRDRFVDWVALGFNDNELESLRCATILNTYPKLNSGMDTNEDNLFGKPQPSPVPQGIPVTDHLIRWILSQDLDISVMNDVIALVQERSNFGYKKYGQRLMSQDGRDDVIDAMQEVGDLLQYAYKAKINGRLDELKSKLLPSLTVLNKMLQ
jgi:hypothetical protein